MKELDNGYIEIFRIIDFAVNSNPEFKDLHKIFNPINFNENANVEELQNEIESLYPSEKYNIGKIISVEKLLYGNIEKETHLMGSYNEVVGEKTTTTTYENKAIVTIGSGYDAVKVESDPYYTTDTKKEYIWEKKHFDYAEGSNYTSKTYSDEIINKTGKNFTAYHFAGWKVSTSAKGEGVSYGSYGQGGRWTFSKGILFTPLLKIVGDNFVCYKNLSTGTFLGEWTLTEQYVDSKLDSLKPIIEKKNKIIKTTGILQQIALPLSAICLLLSIIYFTAGIHGSWDQNFITFIFALVLGIIYTAIIFLPVIGMAVLSMYKGEVFLCGIKICYMTIDVKEEKTFKDIETSIKYSGNILGLISTVLLLVLLPICIYLMLFVSTYPVLFSKLITPWSIAQWWVDELNLPIRLPIYH